MKRTIKTEKVVLYLPSGETLAIVLPNQEGGLKVTFPNDEKIVLGNDDPEYFGVEIKCLPYQGRQRTFPEKVKDLFRTVYV